MNEERSEDLAELIHETKNPKICHKHPRIVCFDALKCPVCRIEKEIPRTILRQSEKYFLARIANLR